MLQLSYNLKIIRSITGLNQTDFGAMFKVTLAMQKSYESGKAKPDALYLQRVSSFTGIPEEQLKNKKIKESDVGIKAEFEEKEDFEDAEVINSDTSDSQDQDLLLEIVTGQKATLQYLREIHQDLKEIRNKLGTSDSAKSGRDAVSEVKEKIKKDRLAERDRQNNR